MEIDILKKQIEEYKKEWQRVGTNRDRLMDMVNQQERKLEQLSGAISALERLITENSKKPEEAQNVGNESGNKTES
jgi:septal ring factor EnvC (AmiA/AmiB activator)